MRLGKTMEIPVGMLFRKFYCHRCGEQLKRQAKKRTVTPQDPDWHEHDYTGRMYFPKSEVVVTEYDFCCTNCGQITTYDEQMQYHNIQKQHGTLILPQALLRQELPWATEKWEKKKALDKALRILWCVALVVIVMVANRLLNG